jgi:biopolymer transport protein ExbD
MRRRSALHQYELRFGPNMTPMVDIVMVILIFFMAGTTIMGPEWVLRSSIPVHAPGGTAGDAASDEPRVQVVLSLRSIAGRTVVTGSTLQQAGIDEVAPWLAQFVRGAGAAEIVVLLQPAADVPYRDVVTLHDACEAAGVTVGLVDAPG